MNIFGNALAALIVFALLGALGAGGYFAFDFVVGLFAGLESQAVKVTVIASAVALLAAMIVASSIRRAAEQIKVSRLSEEKGTTYRLFCELWENLLSQGGKLEDSGSADWSKELATLDLLLSLYGSAAVIKAHTNLCTGPHERGAKVHDLRAHFAQALVEVRKDLGSDTPRNIAVDLKKLFFPLTEADGGVVETMDARRTAGAAPIS